MENSIIVLLLFAVVLIAIAVIARTLFPIPTGIFPWLTPLAAIGFCIIQILGAQWHIRLKEYNILPVNLFLSALSLFVVIGRWGLFST